MVDVGLPILSPPGRPMPRGYAVSAPDDGSCQQYTIPHEGSRSRPPRGPHAGSGALGQLLTTWAGIDKVPPREYSSHRSAEQVPGGVQTGEMHR